MFKNQIENDLLSSSKHRIANPLVFGDYPEVMKKYVGSRLPSFTKQESELVKGACDFFGLNHYSSVYLEDNPNGPVPNPREFYRDMSVNFRGLIIFSKPSSLNMFDVHLNYKEMFCNFPCCHLKLAYFYTPTIITAGYSFSPITVIDRDSWIVEDIKGQKRTQS